MREFEYTESCIYEYLENVLDHYKTAADASFGEWPVEEIDWIPFTKNKFFYTTTKQWFAERNINPTINTKVDL